MSSSSAPTITVELRVGRLRRLQAGALVAAGVLAGWLWLDGAGAGLLGLWAASSWPRWHRRTLRVDVGRVRACRLGARRVWLAADGGRVEVFADELDPGEFARLRRALKARF